MKVLGVLIVLFVAIQFVPYGKNHSNPESVAEPNWDSQQTKATFMTLCGDCHSHGTTWPGYSKVAPVSWLVQHDVDEGREHFNVSMWGVQEKNEGNDAAHEYGTGEMPPWIYTLPRPQTKLSQGEKDQFIAGLKATFNGESQK